MRWLTGGGALFFDAAVLSSILRPAVPPLISPLKINQTLNDSYGGAAPDLVAAACPGLK